MKRRNLMAFITGAGAAGTLLVLPYAGLWLGKNALPRIRGIYIPLFLLPLVWGFWNWLYIRLNRPFSIGIWGSLLGFILGIALALLFYFEGYWFPQILTALVLGPAVYYILWLLIVAPLDSGLEE